MLGPVSSVASSARRRARRRTRLVILVAVLLAFVVGELIDEVVNARTATSARTAETWVAAVESPISDANSQSIEMDLVMTKGASMTRPELTDILSGLVVSSEQEESAVLGLRLSPPAGTAPQWLGRSLSLRARAVGDFRQGVLDAISNGGAQKSRGEMVQSGILLRDAVGSYQHFLHRLPHSAGASALPQASWSKPASLWTSHGLATFAQLLSSAPQLKAHFALSITDISLNPLPEIIPTTTTTSTTVVVPTSSPQSGATSTSTTIGTSRKKKPAAVTTTTTTTTLPPISQIPTGGVPSVIAPTSTLTVIVVVTNTGNVDETHLSVRAQLAGQLVNSSVIASLGPGRSRYIQLHALPVHTASMAACASSALHHDRCTTLRVSLTASSGVTANRHVSLAFFVS